MHRTGRGGQFTYHGPGQRVAYVMLDLKRREPDLRRFVSALEAWLIGTLGAFNIRGEPRRAARGARRRLGAPAREGAGRRGQDRGARQSASGAGVSFHGISLNVEPELAHFDGIVPCGVSDQGVTSLVDLGLPVTMPEVDSALRAEFERIFGPTVAVP